MTETSTPSTPMQAPPLAALGTPGWQGEPGPPGPPGPQGPPGGPVPVGGAPLTVLTKNSATDLDASWKNTVQAAITDTGGQVYNVRAYGAKGDGVADDTAAIQAAIDASTGAADPAHNIRYPTGTVFLPAGTYYVRADSLTIRSVQGFHFEGVNAWQTQIRVHGTTGTSGLLIDGSAHSLYENFSIYIDATLVTSGIDVRWNGPSVSARGTFANTFRNIGVAYGAGDFVYGFGVGLNDNSLQNDGNTFYDCDVAGRRTVGSGDTTTNQAAWRLGTGGAGNNLNHYFYGCNGSSCRYFIDSEKANFFLYGTEAVVFDTVFNIVPWQNYYISGVNTESSGQLLNYSNGSSAHTNFTMTEVLFRPNSLQSDGRWIILQDVGSAWLQNVECSGGAPAGVVPNIWVGNGHHYLQGIVSTAHPDNGGLVMTNSPANTSCDIGSWNQINEIGQVLARVENRRVNVAGLSSTITPARNLRGSAVLSGGTAAVVFGTAEVQSLVATGAASGTFKLQFDEGITTALNWNATAAQVQAALRALATIGGTNVTCTNGPLPNTAVTITFSSAMGSGPQRLITATQSTLSGGTVAVSRTAAGTGNLPETDVAYFLTLAGNANETFSWATKTITGFTVNSSNAGSTATVDWHLIR